MNNCVYPGCSRKTLKFELCREHTEGPAEPTPRRNGRRSKGHGAATDDQRMRIYAHCENGLLSQVEIAKDVGLTYNTVRAIIAQWRLEDESTGYDVHPNDPSIERCRCGLIRDKDHMTCDLAGVGPLVAASRKGETW